MRKLTKRTSFADAMTLLALAALLTFTFTAPFAISELMPRYWWHHYTAAHIALGALGVYAYARHFAGRQPKPQASSAAWVTAASHVSRAAAASQGTHTTRDNDTQREMRRWLRERITLTRARWQESTGNDRAEAGVAHHAYQDCLTHLDYIS